MVSLKTKQITNYRFSYLDSGTNLLQIHINGKIINSVVDSNKKLDLLQWKQKITKHVMSERKMAYDPNDMYLISLGLRFCPQNHGNLKLDVENYIKPIIDGIAAGLFCNLGTNPTDITRFDYDDSNFNNLYVERLPNTQSVNHEGIIISISKK
jgi:hypothetical protein